MTILTDIEAVLNQRPLAYCGPDPMDPMPVTPAQLAIGRNLQELPPITSNGSVSVSKRYRYLQRLLEQFWKRWSQYYLPKMNVRSTWKTKTEELRVGDVCLISEENTTRPSWPLGVIVETMPSRDGLVRTVRLRTAKGYFMRPVQRLHLIEKASLEANGESDNDDEENEAPVASDNRTETERVSQSSVEKTDPPSQVNSDKTAEPTFDLQQRSIDDSVLIRTNQGREDIAERRSTRTRRAPIRYGK